MPCSAYLLRVRENCKIYILLEHKSYPYQHIHIQLLEYMCSIYKEQIKQKKEATLVVPVTAP